MIQRRPKVLDRGAVALLLVLAGCASAGAQGVVSLQSEAADAAEARILRLLDTPVSVEFERRPLVEVMRYFSDSTGITMGIDERALEDASIGAKTPVTCDLRSVTLRSGLRSMLGRMDLTYVIKNEMLIVTTPEKAGNELITRVYLVRDLVLSRSGDRDIEDYSALINLITALIAPTTWDEVGGPGAIRDVRISGAIVISQTREVHEQIVELLESVRRAREMLHLATNPPPRPRIVRHFNPPEPADSSEPHRYVLEPDASWLIPRVHE